MHLRRALSHLLHRPGCGRSPRQRVDYLTIPCACHAAWPWNGLHGNTQCSGESFPAHMGHFPGIWDGSGGAEVQPSRDGLFPCRLWVLCVSCSPLLHAVHPETPFRDTRSRKLRSAFTSFPSLEGKIIKYLGAFCKPKRCPHNPVTVKGSGVCSTGRKKPVKGRTSLLTSH